jgi:peptide/nickel transport system permease protein
VGRYFVRRTLQLIPVLLIISLVVFVSMQLAPGDPAVMRMGRAAARPENQAALERLRHEMGLDKPILVQYAIWLGSVLQGDFGDSSRSGRPVMQMIAGTLPATIMLALVAFLISLVISIPLGIVAALKQGTSLDRAIMAFAVAGVAVPAIWLGLTLILIFSVKLNWLPPAGYVPFTEDPAESLKRVLMPAVTLSFYLTATFTRFLRADMIEVLNEDYIRTARAKGLRERLVLSRHALRNAFIPLLTVMGIEVGALLGGVVLVEQIFGWSGIGWLTLQGVYNRDYNLVQASIVLIAVAYTMINFFVDVGYAFLNPRIREQYRG